MLRPKKLATLSTHALGWALMAALLLGPIPAQAQFGTTGQVLGNVADVAGEPLEGATVSLEHASIDQPRTATADGEGFYNFTDLPPANYRLSVNMDAYSVPAVIELTVRVGSIQRHDYALELGTEVSGEITVLGEASIVETVDSAVNKYIGLEEIQALPLANRTFLDILNILPGVTTGIVGAGLEGRGPKNSISIHGARMNQNLFLIDGAANNDLSDLNADALTVEVRHGPGTSAGTGQAGATFQTGTAMQSFNVDAIQEVQVATSLVSAEYGNASGGVINVITRSGTDQVHASATIQRQSDSLVESGTTAAGEQRSAQEFTRDQASLVVGGPFKLGKTHYFATYEKDDHELGYDFNQSPFVLFPGLAGLGITANHTKRDRLTGKLAHQFTDSNSFTLSTFDNDERADVMNSIFRLGPEFLIPEHYKNESLGISARHVAVLGSAMTLESAASSTQADRDFVSDLDSPRRARAFRSDGSVRPVGAVIVHHEGTNSPDSTNKLESFEINERLNWVRGDHSLRAGAGWNNFKQQSTQEWFTSLGYGFADDFNGPFPTNRNLFLPASDLSVSVNTFHVFVQDDWFKNDRWTLNLGARYDHNDLVDEDTFEPRLGFAFDPKGDGRSVVRFGAGIYHDRTNLIGHVGDLRPIRILGQINPETLETFPGEIPDERIVDPNLGLPEITKVVLGYERRVGARGSVGLHAFYSDSKDLFYTDINNQPLFELDGERLDPTRGTLFTYSNTGDSEVLDLEVQYKHSFANGSSLQASYTNQDAEGNSIYDFLSGNSLVGRIANNPENPEVLTVSGPLLNEVEHSVKLSGIARLPWGLQLSGFFQWRTGTPYSIWDQEGQETPSGFFSANAIDLIGGYNAENHPDFYTLDLRLAKTFTIKQRHDLLLFLDVFNVSDRENVLEFNSERNRNGVIRPNFGTVRTKGRGQTAQFGIRWSM